MMATVDGYESGSGLGGTPISDLRESKPDYDSMYDAVRQSPQYDPNIPTTCSNSGSPKGAMRTSQPLQSAEPALPVRPKNNELTMQEMSELAREIGNGFEEEMIVPDTDTEESPKSQSQLLSYIPEALREPLVIVAIFAFLSHPKVKLTIGKYISQINPTEDGTIPMAGVLIYGIILATIYHFVKKYFL